MSLSDISAVNRQFEDAARKGDLDRLASLYTPDSWNDLALLTPG